LVRGLGSWPKKGSPEGLGGSQGCFHPIQRRDRIKKCRGAGEDARELTLNKNDEQVVLDILEVLGQYFPETECREILATVLEKVDKG